MESDENPQKRSIIHDYFIKDVENDKYKCKACNKTYKIAKDGSTSSLWKHLKTKHNDLLLEIDEITDAMNRLDITEQLVCIYVNLFQSQ